MSFLFYLAPYIAPTEANYQHIPITIAEGLRDKGYEFYSLIDYWWEPEKEKYLFTKKPDNYKYDICIYDSIYLRYKGNIDLDRTKFNVFIDSEDGLYTSSTDESFAKKFNIVLKLHYNKNIKFYRNVYPWAFGLSNRIINELDKTKDLKIIPQVFNCFRVPHNVRDLAISKLKDSLAKKYKLLDYVTDDISITQKDDIYWQHTGRRHDKEYYKIINQSLITYTFGGIIDYKPYGRSIFDKILRKVNKLIVGFDDRNKFTNKYMYIYQFDSWRWWEVLYSNSCPLSLDYEYWDFLLPEMPVNNKHYIGLGALNDICDITLSEEQIRLIGQEGKKWVYEHYSPKPIADRFIKLIGENSGF